MALISVGRGADEHLAGMPMSQAGFGVMNWLRGGSFGVLDEQASIPTEPDEPTFQDQL